MTLIRASALLAVLLPLLAGPLRSMSTAKEAASGAVCLTVGYTAAVFNDVSINDARAATRLWVTKLVEESGIDGTAKTAIFDSVPALLDAARTGEVDVIGMRSRQYLEAGDTGVLEPRFTAMVGDACSEEYGILVQTDSSIDSLGQLKGAKLIVCPGGEGSAPPLWLDTILLRSDLGERRSFFGEIATVKKTPQAVLPVLFGHADACVVSLRVLETLVELNPQVGADLRVLDTSPGISLGIVCLRRGLSADHRLRIEKALSRLHTNPQGQQLLTLFQVDRLVPYDRAHTAGLERLVEEHRSHQAALESGKR
jgi:ABC-type phosphate/phosphonate transport system substrate-binding protein